MLDQNNRELEFYFTSNCIVTNDFYESKGDEFKTITIGDLKSTQVTLYETWSPDTLFINNRDRKYYQRTLLDVVNMILSYNKKAIHKFKPTLVFKTISNETYYTVVDDFYLFDANESYDSNEWNTPIKNMTLKLLCRKNSFNYFKKGKNYSEEMPDQGYASVNLNMSGFTYQEIDFNDDSVFVNNKLTNNYPVNPKKNIFENLSVSKRPNSPKPNFNFIINRECLINNNDQIELYLSFIYNCEKPLKIIEYQDWSKSTSSISDNRRIIKSISPNEFVNRIESLNSYLSINIGKDKTNHPLEFLWFRPTVYMEVQGEKVLAVVNSFEIKSLSDGSQVLNLIINKNFMKNENNDSIDYSNIESKVSNVYLNIDSVSDAENISPDETVNLITSFGYNMLSYKNPAQALSYCGLLEDIQQKIEGEPDLMTNVFVKKNDSVNSFVKIQGMGLREASKTYSGSTINSKYYTKYGNNTHSPNASIVKNNSVGKLYKLSTELSGYYPLYIQFELTNISEGFNPCINIHNRNSGETTTHWWVRDQNGQVTSQWNPAYRLSGWNSYDIEITDHDGSNQGDYTLIIRDTKIADDYKDRGMPWNLNFYATPQNATTVISETPDLEFGVRDWGILSAGSDQISAYSTLPAKKYKITLTQDRVVNIQLTNQSVLDGFQRILDAQIVIIPVDSDGKQDLDSAIVTSSSPWFYFWNLEGDPRGKTYYIEITPSVDARPRWYLDETTVTGDGGLSGYHREQYEIIMYLSDSSFTFGFEPSNIMSDPLRTRKALEVTQPKLTLESKEPSEITLQKSNDLKVSPSKKKLIKRDEDNSNELNTYYVALSSNNDILFSKSLTVSADFVNNIQIIVGFRYTFDLSSRSLIGKNFELRSIANEPGSVITTDVSGFPGTPGAYISYTPPLIVPPDQLNPTELFLVESTTNAAEPGIITLLDPEQNVQSNDVIEYKIVPTDTNEITVFDMNNVLLPPPMRAMQGVSYIYYVNDSKCDGFYFEFQSSDDLSEYAQVKRVGVPGQYDAYIEVIFPIRNVREGGGELYKIVASGDENITPYPIQTLDPLSFDGIIPGPDNEDDIPMPWWGSMLLGLGLAGIGALYKYYKKRKETRNGEYEFENPTFDGSIESEPIDLKKLAEATGDIYIPEVENFSEVKQMIEGLNTRVTNEWMRNLLTTAGIDIEGNFGDVFKTPRLPNAKIDLNKLHNAFTDAYGNRLDTTDVPSTEISNLDQIEVTIVKNVDEFLEKYGKPETEGGLDITRENFSDLVELVSLTENHVLELDFSGVGQNRKINLHRGTNEDGSVSAEKTEVTIENEIEMPSTVEEPEIKLKIRQAELGEVFELAAERTKRFNFTRPDPNRPGKTLSRSIDFRNLNLKDPLARGRAGNYNILLEQGITDARSRRLERNAKINTGLIRVREFNTRPARYFLIASEHRQGSRERTEYQSGVRAPKRVKNGVNMFLEGPIGLLPKGTKINPIYNGNSNIPRDGDPATKEAFMDGAFPEEPTDISFPDQIENISAAVRDSVDTFQNWELGQFTREDIEKMFEEGPKLEEIVDRVKNNIENQIKDIEGLKLDPTKEQEIRNKIKNKVERVKNDILKTITVKHTNLRLMQTVFASEMTDLSTELIKDYGQFDVKDFAETFRPEYRASPPHIRLFDPTANVPPPEGEAGTYNTKYRLVTDPTQQELLSSVERGEAGRSYNTIEELRAVSEGRPVRGRKPLDPADRVLDRLAEQLGLGEFVQGTPGLIEGAYDQQFEKLDPPYRVTTYPDDFKYTSDANVDTQRKIEELRGNMRSTYSTRKKQSNRPNNSGAKKGDYIYERSLPDNTIQNYSTVDNAFDGKMDNFVKSTITPQLKNSYEVILDGITRPITDALVFDEIVTRLDKYGIKNPETGEISDILRLDNPEKFEEVLEVITNELTSGEGSGRIFRDIDGGEAFKLQLDDIITRAFTTVTNEAIGLGPDGELGKESFINRARELADTYPGALKNRNEVAVRQLFSSEVSNEIFNLITQATNSDGPIRDSATEEFKQFASKDPEIIKAVTSNYNSQFRDEMLSDAGVQPGKQTPELSDVDFKNKYGFEKGDLSSMTDFLDKGEALTSTVNNAVNTSDLKTTILDGLDDIANNVQELRDVEFVQESVTDFQLTDEFREIRDILTNPDTYGKGEFEAEIEITKAMESASLDALQEFIDNGGIANIIAEVEQYPATELDPEGRINSSEEFRNLFKNRVLDEVSGRVADMIEDKMPEELAKIKSNVKADEPPSRAELEARGREMVREHKPKLRERVRRRFRFF